MKVNEELACRIEKSLQKKICGGEEDLRTFFEYEIENLDKLAAARVSRLTAGQLANFFVFLFRVYLDERVREAVEGEREAIAAVVEPVDDVLAAVIRRRA